jgi:S-adenosyl methyltransferase
VTVPEPGGVPGIDVTTPNMARIYDCWLGGKDNFPADREVGEKMAARWPGLPRMARDNRAFVVAAVARAAGIGGIAQFADLGAGLPAHPAVHEAARSVIPSARVAYVDNDPVVVLHARALLAKGEGLAAVSADLTDPDAVLSDPCLHRVIDLGRPVGVILGAVLHFYAAEKAQAIVAGYAERVAPGSWVIASVAHMADQRVADSLGQIYTPAGTFHNHSADDLARILRGAGRSPGRPGRTLYLARMGGLKILPPGIQCARRWIAGIAEALPGTGGYMLTAVAEKR